jgi:hypothetical protein
MTIQAVSLKLAPWVGLEPTTNRLTADCSTIELPRNTRCAGRPAEGVPHAASIRDFDKQI